jgi:two-component system nitrogen regulation response regulator GlnG
LRERREDIPMLARYFLQRSAQQLGVEPKRISDAAIERLSHFQFPGNVRQLENICHWLTVMAPAQVIETKDLPPEVLDVQAPAVAAPESMTPQAEAPLAPAVQQVSGAAPSASADASAAWAAAPLSAPGSAALASGTWEPGLEAEALRLLATDRTDVWDVLTRRFETSLIQAALATTRGRRIEAAQKLGIGRNTITRKIQELGIEE